MRHIGEFVSPIHWLVGVRDHVERAMMYLARDEYAAAVVHIDAAQAAILSAGESARDFIRSLEVN